MVTRAAAADTASMQTHDCSRVFIAEDSASIRSLLVELLGEIDGVCAVGEAETPAGKIREVISKCISAGH
jgi:hypothetical protein